MFPNQPPLSSAALFVPSAAFVPLKKVQSQSFVTSDSFGGIPDLETLRSFQNQIAAIQRDAVWWLHTVVPSISKTGAKDYVHW